jgi:hypothetical protein
VEGANGMIDYEWIKKAVETVKGGLTKKVDSPDGKIKVYECGTIIRIDIKGF